MKRGLFCIAISFLVLLHSAAQTGRKIPASTAVIYFHSADYLATENADVNTESTETSQSTMHLNVRSRSVVSKLGTARQIFPKDSIFGYRLRNGTSYRWDKAQRRAFEIVDHGPIVIYRCYEAQYGVKDPLPKAVFYFSKDLETPILALNPLNIKRVFPYDVQLHHLLDLLPRTDLLAQRTGENGSFFIQTLLKNLHEETGSSE